MPLGFWASARKVGGFEWQLVESRWQRLGDNKDAITQEKFFDVIGDREGIPFAPGITLAEAEIQRNRHDFEKSMEKVDPNFFGTLAGGALALADPVSVGTMPFGGANFARGAAAVTWRALVQQFAIGGAKAGVAAAPLELAFQQGEGETDIPRLAGAVIGPAVAAPFLGVLGRVAVRGARRVTGVELNATTRNTALDDALPPDQRIRIIDEADQVSRPPVLEPRTAPPRVPKRLLEETFQDYQGGWVGWTRDLAARRPAALAKARQMGIDPEDNEILDRLVDSLSVASEARATFDSKVPLQFNDGVKLLRRGEQPPADVRQSLLDAGLAKPRVRANVEGGRPQARLRAGPDGAVAPEVELSVVGRRVADALDNPRTPQNRALLQRIDEIGPGAARQEIQDRIRLGEDFDEDPFALPRVIDGQADPAAVIQHLDAAGFRRRIDPGRPPPIESARATSDPVSDPGANARLADEAVNEVRAQARKLGVNTEELDDLTRRMLDGVRTCGR